MDPDKKIDDLLSRWDVAHAPDPDLRRSVVQEIALRQRRAFDEAASDENSFVAWARALASRPMLSGMAAAVFVLVGMGLTRIGTHFVSPGEDELTLSYRLTIDPIYRVQAMAGASDRGPTAARSAEERFLVESLGWLQTELDLSPRQFERVSALHNSYESAFNSLFLKLLASYSRYGDLDRQRMSDDVIDYIAFYELLQEQERLKAMSSELTAELIEKVSQVVGPDQRERFRRLVQESYPSVPGPMDSRQEKQNA